MAQSVEKPPKARLGRKPVVIVVAVLLLGGLGFGGYTGWQTIQRLDFELREQVAAFEVKESERSEQQVRAEAAEVEGQSLSARLADTEVQLVEAEASVGRLETLLAAARIPAVRETAVPSDPAGPIIESRVAGEFRGWDGQTNFRLTNGQVWQQVSYAYLYSYALMPRVVIYAVPDGNRMTVEGVSSTILVRRVA